jgi:hypothetical protein
MSACRKLKLDPCLSPCTSVSSKWIKDLNIRPETLKLVQERAGSKLELIGKGNDLQNRTQMTASKRNDGQMALHKIKKLLHNKRNGDHIKEATQRMGENLCQLYI